MSSTPSRVIVVGSLNVDVVAYVERAPGAGETTAARRVAHGFGGKGANQAVMAALAGAQVSMIGCIGDDALGAGWPDALRAAGIDAEHVRILAGESSGIALITVDRSGENRIVIGGGANQRLDADHVTAALARLSPPGVIVGQLETPQAATVAAFRIGRSAGAITLLNPAPAAPLDAEVVASCDWLVPNETELAVLLASMGAEDEQRLAERVGGGVVVTRGGRGASLHVAGQQLVAVPAAAVPVVDTTGAGDAFVGVFAARLAGGDDPHDAVRAAVATATDSVTRPGAQASYRHLLSGD